MIKLEMSRRMIGVFIALAAVLLFGNGCMVDFPIRRSQLPPVTAKRSGGILVRQLQDQRNEKRDGVIGIEKNIFGGRVNGFTNTSLTRILTDYFCEALENNGYMIFQERFPHDHYYRYHFPTDYVIFEPRSSSFDSFLSDDSLHSDESFQPYKFAFSTNLIVFLSPGLTNRAPTNHFECILEGTIKEFWVELALHASSVFQVELTLKAVHGSDIFWRHTFQARRNKRNIYGTQSKAEDLVQEVVDDVLNQAVKEFNAIPFASHVSSEGDVSESKPPPP